MKFNKTLQILALLLAYILLGGALFYFGKGREWLLPLYLLIILWSLPFLILSGVLQFFLQAEKKSRSILIAGAFALVQGGIGFALAHFMFNLPWLPALSFPLGALLASIALIISWNAKAENGWAPLVLTGLIATGLAVALRFEGIFTALAFALAWLNTMLLGFKGSENSQRLWARATHAVALLAIARAAIQYYLIQSNYDTLGVVISHSYSFVALFAGIFVPLAFSQMEKNRLMPSVLALVLLGILAPALLGIFIHVRPVAGYLLGLTVSAFSVGLLLAPSFKVFLLGYLNLITATAALPLFNEYNNLTRETRLFLLAGLAVFLVIIFMLNTWLTRRPSATITESPA